MRRLASIIFAVALSTLTGATYAGGSWKGDELFGLAGKVFVVEATVLSSPAFPEYEGTTFPSCFTFQEDGSWIDLEFPGEGAEPVPGVWIQHTEFPYATFTTTATDTSLGWTLIEYGIATLGRRSERMITYAMVFAADNELVFYVKTHGHAVETCPL